MFDEQSSNIISSPHAASTPAVAFDSEHGIRVVTDLGQVAPAETSKPSPINAGYLVNGAAAVHEESAGGPSNAQSLADANLEHLYLSKEHSAIHGGMESAPGDRTLLNDKARQFPEFSYDLLNQTLVAAQKLETQTLQRRRIPDEIKPMILVATMNPEGKLVDLAIEQHSGMSEIDRIVIDACKKGLWAMNPPAGARAADGMYRMRIEGAVGNYSHNFKQHYTYITNFGLALL